MKKTTMLLGAFLFSASPTYANDAPAPNMSTPEPKINMSVPPKQPKAPDACYPPEKKLKPLIG